MHFKTGKWPLRSSRPSCHLLLPVKPLKDRGNLVKDTSNLPTYLHTIPSMPNIKHRIQTFKVFWSYSARESNPGLLIQSGRSNHKKYRCTIIFSAKKSIIIQCEWFGAKSLKCEKFLFSLLICASGDQSLNFSTQAENPTTPAIAKVNVQSFVNHKETRPFS